MTDVVPRAMAAHEVSDHDRRHGPQEGPFVYLVVRHNGTMLGCEPTRHDAIGTLTKRVNALHGADGYDVLYVPIQNVPFEDLRRPANPTLETEVNA